MTPKPSQKRLEAAFPGKGKALRELLTGARTPKDYESVKKWIEVCHHVPKYQECLMCALNEILEGHGVEAIWGEDARWPEADYVNMGDTYASTLLLNWNTGRVEITTVGDWVEKNQRRYNLR